MDYRKRLTHVRSNGIKSGYWTNCKKDELTQRLGEYEDTGLSPEEIKAALKENPIIPEDEFKKYLEDVKEMVATWKKERLGYLSRRQQLVDVILASEETVFSVDQLRQMFSLIK